MLRVVFFGIVFSASSFFVPNFAARTSWAVPPTAQPPTPDAPTIAEASDEGLSAIATFQWDQPLKCELFAAEPQTANPVAFTIDDRGRLYVCESYRQGRGVTDNRKHDKEWVDADLAAMTVADREAYHRRLLGKQLSEYTRYDDQIRVLEDRDGDGRADYSTIFANRFNALVDGTAAGVLAHRGDVFLTCIPHLWRLRDTDGDNITDQRDSLSYGYGVRVAFRGHDSHGLILGPDGRLYFSIGDRGYNIETDDGRQLFDPASGAVFRCELDGSKLEVFATGLRNPQELAFDDHGNLFTADNNSDSGDKARWVYVVRGGDSGWRMYYQYLGDRGPFNREKLWHPFHKDTAAYTVPPVINIADGPSGLVFYPGTGLNEDFKDRFLLCDFRGGAVNSGIRSFRVKADGAFFQLTDQSQPFWKILATDLAFAPDGSLYVSDWVNGWNGEGKGRIYRFFDEATAKSEIVQQVKEVLASDLSKTKTPELAKLLSHVDRRVRLKAQWELARRDDVPSLKEVSVSSDSLLARLHSVWGLGQIGRLSTSADTAKAAWNCLTDLVNDGHAEVRAQVCKTLADAPADVLPADVLNQKLADEEPRVRYFASQLASIHGPKAMDRESRVAAIQSLLTNNADQDPILRHGGIIALKGSVSSAELSQWTTHPDRSVRLGAVIALRKQASPLIAAYLNDPDQQIVLEAARGIYDTPISRALPKLAEMIQSPPNSDPLLRRVLNANYRLGGAERADALAAFAAGDFLIDRRVEALEMLADWAAPDARDRVLCAWRPIEPREAQVAAQALQHWLPALLAGPIELQNAVTTAAAVLGVKDIVPTLAKLVVDEKSAPTRRAQSLLVLNKLKATETADLADVAFESNQPELRAAARRVWLASQPQRGWESLRQGIRSQSAVERQDALQAIVQWAVDKNADGKLRQEMVTELVALLGDVRQGNLPSDTSLNVIEAARAMVDFAKPDEKASLTSTLAELERAEPEKLSLLQRAMLNGGSAERGKKIFFERTEVSCVRCHKIGQRGGDVGPPLTKVAAEKKREYLLESIVVPDRAIAKNFESIQIRTEDGVVLSGVLKRETDDVVEIMTVEGRLLTVDKEIVEARKKGRSAMPEDLAKRLTSFELRDLVEFLSTLR